MLDRALALLLLVPLAPTVSGQQPRIQMRPTAYRGWPNCIWLSNGTVEVIATTDVGPRILHYSFMSGQNLFKIYDDQQGLTGGKKWHSFGGHRLWHAPEALPRSYSPDNSRIAHDWDGRRLELTQPTEPDTGIQKQIVITLSPAGSHVKVVHRLINRNPWAVELAAWALSVMAPGGRAILPQEPHASHDDALLPARPMVLWHYTDMQDRRWIWGTKYLQLRQDVAARTPQKIGVRNTAGWAAYALGGELFLKRFPLLPDARYPDYGCNNEIYTDPEMLELESLGPLRKLPPGERLEHVEHWFLHKVDIGTSERDIDAKVLPLVQESRKLIEDK